MNPRAVAANIIHLVINQGRSLSSAMEMVTPANKDRPLIQELCYGTLRCYPRLKLVLKNMMNKSLKAKDGDVQALLLLGLYQLSELRVPDHAAVSETVAASNVLKKPWARGLINGVLRNFLRDSDSLLAKVMADDEGRWMHPQWLIDAIRQAWPEDWQVILEAGNQRPPMTLRVNQSLGSVAEYMGLLDSVGIAAQASALVSGAILLTQPTDVEMLPGFRDGRVSVQDEAAQLAASLLSLAPGQRVLDVCAAPGGKTGHILETAQVDLVAVDVDKGRIKRVQENLSRLGQAAKLIEGDAVTPGNWWDGEVFDRILLDAPCSATGVIRRHPDIKVLRRAEDIQALVELQSKILISIWSLLKPGGILLYATCSVLPEENDQQIAAFIKQQSDAGCLTIDAEWGRATKYGRQILPGVVAVEAENRGMDGFYYACLKKC